VSAPTGSLSGRVAISSISSCEVGQSATERWDRGARGGVTVDALRRLNRAGMESITGSWGIVVVRAERSRSDYLSDLSRASNTIFRVNTLR